MLLEYEAVMTREEHRKVSGLSGTEIDVLLDSYAKFALPIEVFFSWRPFLRDPGDNMVLDAATNGQADAIVTFNHRDFEGVYDRFGIEIVSPKEVCRRIWP